MKLTFIFFTLICSAFAQYECASQLKPMKPVGLYCSGDSETSLSCVCSGNRCSWAWGCGVDRARQGKSQGIDTAIYSRIAQPVHVDTPSEAAHKAQELRNMQLRNEQLRLETERLRMENDARQRALDESRQRQRDSANPSKSTNDTDSASTMFTHGMLNCRAWKTLSEDARVGYVLGGVEILSEAFSSLTESEAELKARFSTFMPYKLKPLETGTSVDQFCYSPENSALPVRAVLRVVSLKAAGASPTEIEGVLSSERRIAAMTLDAEKRD